MHVVWINRRADFVGGAERYIADTTAALREHGIRSSLLYEVDGWMSPEFTSLFDAAFPLVSPTRQIRELDADVVYVHQLSTESLLPAITLAGPPVVRFFHDHKPFCPREHKYKVIGHATCTETVGLNCYPCLGVINRGPGLIRLRRPGQVLEEQELSKRLSALVVGSQYMKRHLVAHGFLSERTHVIPPFVTVPQDEANALRSDTTVLFVGALLRGKGLDTLLHAFVDVPRPARLHVVGDGEQKGMFTEMVAELGLADRVYFAGRLPKEEVAQWYRKAACVVVPSRTPETFGLVGPEAMLRSAPVVATDVGGMGEWLHDGLTGLSVPSSDSKSMAQAIRQILGDTNTTKILAANALLHCQQSYSKSKHTKSLKDLFQSLTAVTEVLARA